jgi:hypothetical protein
MRRGLTGEKCVRCCVSSAALGVTVFASEFFFLVTTLGLF